MTTMTDRPVPAAPRRSAMATTRAALALLKEQSWLGALAGVIVISVVFVFLGRWQYHRHEARTERNNLVNENWDATPVTLSDLLPTVQQDPTADLPADLEWRRVTVRGTYLTGQTVLLRNRPQNDQNGYDVLVPLRSDDGPILLVDRGWIPAGSSGAGEPDSVPAPPAGEVTVIARLRPSEPETTRKAPAGQANRIAVRELGSALGAADAARVVGAYGLVTGESPAPGQQLTLATKPDPGLGINFAYACQWVAFAIAAYAMFGVALVREVQRRAGEEPQPIRLWRRRERDEFDEY